MTEGTKFMVDVSYARKTFGGLEAQVPGQKKGSVIVIAGRGNVGKTSLLKTLWDSKRVKTVAVADARGRAHVLPDREGLSIFQMKDWPTYTKFLNGFKAEPNAFDVVVIDTYSEIQGMDLKNRGLYNAEEKMRLKIYGDSHMDMSDQTRTLYDLAAQYGVHVILTLWVKPGKDEKTGVDLTKLYLTNQFEEYFRSIVDYIGILELGSAPRAYPPVLSFVPSNTTPQKFSPPAEDAERLAKIPKVIYRPSLGHLIDAFCGDEFPVDEHNRP